MKKYLIRLDLEGVSGIISYEQATPGNADYAEGRRLFMGDLLAAIDGLFEGGADEIYLYDEHCSARNVFIDELPENVYYYSGKPSYSEEWRGGLDASFEGMIMLGFHSKAGSTGCLLNHSYDLNISNIDVNGISLGEIGMETAIAGEAGVPLLTEIISTLNLYLPMIQIYGLLRRPHDHAESVFYQPLCRRIQSA